MNGETPKSRRRSPDKKVNWPARYSPERFREFEEREWNRECSGRMTFAAWYRLPKAKRILLQDPEATYWRSWNWRMDNPDKRAAYEAARRGRASAARVGDTHGFYRSVREAATVECYYCGRRVVGSLAHVDHVVPLAKGGAHERANLAAACQGCNARKGTKTEAEFRAILAAEARPNKPRPRIQNDSEQRNRAPAGVEHRAQVTQSQVVTPSEATP